MGIHDFRVQVIPDGKGFKLFADSGNGHGAAKPADKKRAVSPSLRRQPVQALFLEGGGDVNPPGLISLGVEVPVTHLHVRQNQCYQLADPHTGGGDEAHNKIEGVLLILPQPVFQILIVRLADDVVDERFLLEADGGDGYLGISENSLAPGCAC